MRRVDYWVNWGWSFPVLASLLLLVGCGTPPSEDLRAAYAAQVPAAAQPAADAAASMRPSTPVNQLEVPMSQNTAVPSLTPTGVARPIVATPTIVPAPPRQHAIGHYVFPVQPMQRARYGTCHHDYPASDIFAPLGTPVMAVTDGVIEYVSMVDRWNAQEDGPATRGGLSVALIGDDAVRYYYSHFSKVVPGIAPGVRVTAGQQIGEVGKSGNARNTPSHLHFGISRPTTPDDWMTRRGEINPAPYLTAWSVGQMLIPDLAQVGGGVCSAAPTPSGTEGHQAGDQPGESRPAPEPTPLSLQRVRSAAPEPHAAAPTQPVAPTYRLRVTRQGMVGQTTANGHIIQPNDVFVSLPCRCALSRRGGNEFQVRLSANGRSLVVPVWDVGPYWTTDDFWNPVRSGFPDLPTGWPADHAAFVDGYQDRQAELGPVRFPSAVDIGDGAYWSLGLKGAQGIADVTFLWLGTDPGPNPTPIAVRPVPPLP